LIYPQWVNQTEEECKEYPSHRGTGISSRARNVRGANGGKGGEVQGDVWELAAPTTSYPTMRVIPIKPVYGFVQFFKEKFLIPTGGHDFQPFAIYFVQLLAVVTIIKHKSLSLPNKFRQFRVAFDFSWETWEAVNFLSKPPRSP